MARVMNQRSELPTTIVVTTIKQFIDNGISQEFLDELTFHPYNTIGVRRKTHYILKTEEPIKQSRIKFIYESDRLRNILDACSMRGFQMVLINY
jgi:hypothetical protein